MWMNHHIDDETELLRYEGRGSSMNVNANRYQGYHISIIRFYNTSRRQHRKSIESKDNITRPSQNQKSSQVQHQSSLGVLTKQSKLEIKKIGPST